jgi:RNA polymerase sigma-70 factor, ECF subfamily
MDSTSATLLRRLTADCDHAAWTRFVQLYTPLLFFWARKAGLAEPDAADLVQDVFCVLVRKLPQFQYNPAKSFRAWLRTVLLNIWRNRIRQKVVATGLADERLPFQEPATADHALQLEEVEYRQHLVAQAVALMQADFEPATWRACWQLVVEGRPAAQVASNLGLTVNAVYLAKSRVLATLRRELDGLLD